MKKVSLVLRDNLQQFTIPFRKLSEENANISLGYDRGKIDARLAMNYRSSYLDYLGDEVKNSLMMTLDMALFDLPMIIRPLTSLLNTRLTSNFPTF